MAGTLSRLTKVLLVVCLVSFAGISGVAQANDGGWGCDGRHKQHSFRRIAKKLGLTDAQKTQAKAIFQGNKPTVQPLIDSLKTEKKALRALMYADTVDEAAIRAETAKVAGIQADLNVNRAKVGAQFRAILTPGQLATLKSLKQKHQDKGNQPVSPFPN